MDIAKPAHLPPAQPDQLPHGGRLTQARRRYPDAPSPFIDLSTGINPIPYPLPPLPPDAWARLPEPEDLLDLQANAARAYKATGPDMVAAAPGTQILIDLLPRLFAARHVRVLGPTYAEHAAAWAAVGADVTTVSAFAELDGADVAVLCNPNNPDGGRHPSAQLLGLAARQGARGGLLIVDEAFADLAPDDQLAPFLGQEPIILLRSFGKAYGLAGLRLGFALAAPASAAIIRRALGPWPVSGPAIAIARQALSDAPWLEATRLRLAADGARMDGLLTGAGLRVIGGTPLFRLAEGAEAAALADSLGQAGILVRCFPSHPRWLRCGLPGTPDAWARLERALSS